MRMRLGPRVDTRAVAAPVTIEVITGDEYLVSLEPPDDGSPQINRWHERALFTFHEDTGLFQAETEYGTFSHYWPGYARRENLFEFLADVDFDYFMKKASKQPYREFDDAGTRRELWRLIIEQRRCADATRAEARERWLEVDAVCDAAMSGDDFMRLWHESSTLSAWLYGIEVWYVERDRAGMRRFWDQIWSALLASPEFARARAETQPPVRKAA